jgi:hypothetical protein
MKLSPPRRTRTYRPSSESLASMRATVTRLTGIRIEAGINNLDDAEASELLELTRKTSATRTAGRARTWSACRRRSADAGRG